MDIVLHFNNLKLPKCHSLFSAIFFDQPLSLQKTLPDVKVISPSVCADEKVHYNHNITITVFSMQVFQSFFFVMLSLRLRRAFLGSSGAGLCITCEFVVLDTETWVV